MLKILIKSHFRNWGGATASDHLIRTYNSLSQIGYSDGSETIVGIIQNLPTHSEIMYTVGASNNISEYPNSYGLCIIRKSYDSRVTLDFYVHDITSSSRYVGWGTYSSSKGVTWSGWKEEALAENFLSSTSTVPIANGGTGSTARNEALFNLSYIGQNPITSTTDDTVETWIAKGNGFCFFTNTGCINDQPNQWGILINYYVGSEIFQIWHSQPNGNVYYRGGNASGWDGTWSTKCLPLTGGTVNGTIYTQTIVPTTALSGTVGSPTNPWASTNSKHHYIYDANKVQSGRISSDVAGTTSTNGEVLCILGNSTANGKAGNARGRIRLYNYNTGYTDIIPTTSGYNYTLTLPDVDGTLALKRTCELGQSSSTTTNPWYKVASFKCTVKNDDPRITFYVVDTYGSYKSGILKCHVRVDANISFHSSSTFRWLQNDGFNPSDFVLAYQNSSDNTYCNLEIWTKISTAWQFRNFIVISEGKRTGETEVWTLYNQSSAGYASSPTSGYTQVASTSNIQYGTGSAPSTMADGQFYVKYS